MARSHLSDMAALAIGIELGPDREYFESVPAPLSASEMPREITFRLDEATWKSARTEWKAVARPPAGKLHSVTVLLYAPGDAGEVVLDKIRLHKH